MKGGSPRWPRIQGCLCHLTAVKWSHTHSIFCNRQPGHASGVRQRKCQLMSTPALPQRVACMQGLCEAHEADIHVVKNDIT